MIRENLWFFIVVTTLAALSLYSVIKQPIRVCSDHLVIGVVFEKCLMDGFGR